MTFSIMGNEVDTEHTIVRLAEKFRGRLPDTDVNNAVEFAQAREWGVAVDILCFQLHEYCVMARKQELDELKSLCDVIKMDDALRVLMMYERMNGIVTESES